ncbi:putative reverse transcriptase domain-containing protein [Tanacetum coccineum]
MSSVRMVLGAVVNNPLPSTPGWKGLGNRSPNLLALQPLQLMLKTRLLTLRSCLRFWGVLMSSRLGWQVTSWKVMLSVGGRLSEQQKYEREYHTIRQRDGEPNGEFMKRFLRLAGFLGKKASTQEEHAKNFKWALCDRILDGIVNTEFTDVAQVANTARNIEILCERSSQNNKRNCDGDRIRPTTQGNNQRGYDQKRYDGRSHDRQGSSQRRYDQKGYDGRNYDRLDGNSDQKSRHNLDRQYNRSSGVTGACFICGSTRHMARDCPKNGRNGGRGDGNDNQPAANGRVFSSTNDQAANSLGLVVINHEYQNCPLRFDDKIRFANLFPMDMNDFDVILGMKWLAEHRAPIDCHTNRVILDNMNSPEFIYLFHV